MSSSTKAGSSNGIRKIMESNTDHDTLDSISIDVQSTAHRPPLSPTNLNDSELKQQCSDDDQDKKDNILVGQPVAPDKNAADLLKRSSKHEQRQSQCHSNDLASTAAAAATGNIEEHRAATTDDPPTGAFTGESSSHIPTTLMISPDEATTKEGGGGQQGQNRKDNFIDQGKQKEKKRQITTCSIQKKTSHERDKEQEDTKQLLPGETHTDVDDDEDDDDDDQGLLEVILEHQQQQHNQNQNVSNDLDKCLPEQQQQQKGSDHKDIKNSSNNQQLFWGRYWDEQSQHQHGNGTAPAASAASAKPNAILCVQQQQEKEDDLLKKAQLNSLSTSAPQPPSSSSRTNDELVAKKKEKAGAYDYKDTAKMRPYAEVGTAMLMDPAKIKQDLCSKPAAASSSEQSTAEIIGEEEDTKPSALSRPGAHKMFPLGSLRQESDPYLDIQIGGISLHSNKSKEKDLRQDEDEEDDLFLSAFLVVEDEDNGNNNDDDEEASINPSTLFGGELRLSKIGEESTTIRGDESTFRDSTLRDDSTTRRGDVSDSVTISPFFDSSHLRSLSRESIPGSSVKAEKYCGMTKAKVLVIATFVALVLVIVGLVAGLAIHVSIGDSDNDISAGGGANNEVQAPTTFPPSGEVPTIERIRKEGVLKCGHRPPPAADIVEEPEIVDTFDAHLCYAIAAALQVKVNFTDASGSAPFHILANGTVDVLTRSRTHTMERDFHEGSSGVGYSFSIPYLYAGVQAAGDPFFVTQCADQNFRNLGECADLKVCVLEATTHEKILTQFLTIRKIVAVGSLAALRRGLAQGDCNVIVHEGQELAESLVRDAGYTGDFVLGTQLYSKEPLGIVTRSDDPVFSRFVNSVLQALFVAEERNVRKTTAHEFPIMDDTMGAFFSYTYPNAYKDAVEAGGNYGELYKNFFEPLFPRQTVNRIYKPSENHNTGLFYAHPFGNIENDRGSAPLGIKMQFLLERGFLRCGILKASPGLAWWEDLYGGSQAIYSGMALDYCRALSASLYSGNTESLMLLPISDAAEGAAFLMNGDVDVVAGASWTLELDMGFSLSQPYFYGLPDYYPETLCMMTRIEDHEWSAYVYWVVAGTIYAEEKGITSKTSNQMPEVRVLGPSFQRMLRDAILVVGNLADIYERNMQTILPRQAPNVLNGHPEWGPQHYPIEGFD